MKILIVDDDPHIREILTIACDRAGYITITANDGQSAIRCAHREAPDLIVLDVGLPEWDGLEVCRRIRATSDVPILFLTARDDEVDRILGLEMGADDYVTKPFSPRELLARIKAILKRTHATPARALSHGPLRIDPARHLCHLGDTPITLTATEMALLTRLMQHPDMVVTRPQLVDAVWGRTSQISDRTLDSHLRNLRAKLGTGLIDTVHGIGLRMAPQDA